MGRRVRVLAAALAVLAAMAGTAWGGTPDPDLSTVPNVLLVPGGTTAYVVNIVGANGPIDSAVVELNFSAEADAAICWCDGQSHPLIEATTDANGDATFYISGGGCLDPDSTVSAPVEVVVNGYSLTSVGTVSPDAVDGNGISPWNGWDPGTSCSCQTTDGIYHTAPIALGFYSYCSDFNSDGLCDLIDGIICTAPIANGYSCSGGVGP